MPSVRRFLSPILIAIISAMAWTSCQFTFTEEQSARHIELDSTLYFLEGSIETVPIDSLQWIISRMNTSLEALRTAYKDTTDTLFLVEVLPSYQSSHQELKQLPDQLERLTEQIDYSKRQLSGLQADVEQGKIKPAEVDEFLDVEEAHIQEMLKRADTLRHILEVALRRYYHTQPQVEERI